MSQNEQIKQDDEKDDVFGCQKSTKFRRKTVDEHKKSMKKVIAPFCKVVRRGGKNFSFENHEMLKDKIEIQIFLSSSIDFTSLLVDTANVLRLSTQSSGVLVYLVDSAKNEIYLKPQHMNNLERHKVNWPIGEGKTMAAHAAATKQFVMIEDASTETRFSQGMTWPDAKTALCLPVVQPDNTCFAVLELYRTNDDPYFEDQLKAAQCCASWMGAAVHQANRRVSIEQQLYLSKELLTLLMQHFSDQFNLEKIIYEMLNISKHCLKAMRSNLFIIDREFVGAEMMADVYDESWDTSVNNVPKKQIKISLANTDTPWGLAANTGHSVNVDDVYSDKRFHKEIDPTSGCILRSVLCVPLLDKSGLIGVISVMNKLNEKKFTNEDKESFEIIANYCRQVVQYAYLHHKYIAARNLNYIYADLLEKHMKPCVHILDSMMENHVSLLPEKFDQFEWYIQSDSKDKIPELVFFMINTMSSGINLDRIILSDFILTVLNSYRDNPYHNSEHAFIFAHTMYLILSRSCQDFTKIEKMALIIGGFCHDIDHPGFNNSYLVENKHPLAFMYTDSILENHHYFLTRKLLLDKGVLKYLTPEELEEFLDEIRFNILSTDLAIHFRIRAELAPISAEKTFDWNNSHHRKLLKSVMMTSCDLGIQAKPFGIVKQVTKQLYEEFYAQGDMERLMGYTPLSMMDRTKSYNQATDQIQFLQVVALPCFVLLRSLIPKTYQMAEYCTQAKESWCEVNELKGKKLWHHFESFARLNTSTSKEESKSILEKSTMHRK